MENKYQMKMKYQFWNVTIQYLVVLKQLKYTYDHHRTDVLCQTIIRLPSKYHSGKVKYCFNLR